jgi:hypothetical protein
VIAADRERIRQARNQSVRARIENLRALYGHGNTGSMFCSRCGIGVDNWTPGCRTCGDRWRRWRKVGTVSEQRFQEEKTRVSDFTYEVNVTSGRLPHRRTPPVSTWKEHRAAFNLTGPLIQPRRTWNA